MMIKFLNRGKGSGKGAVDYVMSDKDHTKKTRPNPPIVLRGNPVLTGELADSLSFENKYRSAVIAWHPDDKPTLAQINEAVDAFERLAFSGLERDQYDFTAVLHEEDDDKHHVHIIIPRVELTTGKSFNPSPPGWQKHYDPLRDLLNEKYGWVSPDIERFPENAKTTQLGSDALFKGARLESKELINEYIIGKIKNGKISNREDIINSLKELGLSIPRQGKDYITICGEDNKRLRLKGAFYDENFRAERATKEEHIGKGGREPEDTGERIKELDRRLEEILNNRAEYNRNRYKPKNEYSNKIDGFDREQGCEAQPEDQSIIDESMDYADINRPCPLSWHLNRQLGANAVDIKPNTRKHQENQQSRDNAFNFGEEKWKNKPELLWEWEDEITLRPDQRRRASLSEWIQNFTDEIRGIYDRTRAETDRRIEQIIKSIRAGAEAAAESNRELDKASRSLERATGSINECNKRMELIKMNSPDELERFKTNINLVEYVSSKGYELNKRESSGNSKIMEKAGDKIIVATDKDGHGIYFSVRDDNDNGSIVDFIKNRQNLSLGHIRKELRNFSGLPQHEIKNKSLSRPVVTSKDIQKVLIAYSKTFSAIPSYLIDKRCIDDKTIKDPRFSSVIRVDYNKNAVFPHYDLNGLCGYELKNNEFTGFASGGTKGIWCSSNISSAKTIVFCESAIDALSHAQLKYNPDAAYTSIGGSMSPEQHELIKIVFKKAADRGANIVLAFDNDENGEKLAEQMAAWAKDIVVDYHIDMPKLVKDWNKVLQDQNNGNMPLTM